MPPRGRARRTAAASARAERRGDVRGRGDATGGLGEPAPPSAGPLAPPRRSPRRTRSTWPSSMSWPRQSASAPASESLNGALLHPHRLADGLHLERVGDDRPREPELVAQQPGELGAAERGRHVVDRRDDEVGRHDRARAGGDRRPERRPARPRAALRASRGRRAGPRWESTSVAPWPGKCFAQAATPPAWRPVTNAATWRETSAGSEPNERTPITGLSGLVLTSATGARSSVIPTARSSSASARAICSVSATSSIAPSARWPGTRAAAIASSRVTSPPSSSIATTVAAETRIDVGQAPQLLRPLDVAREEDDAAEARRRARARASPGAVVPAKPGEDAPVREAIERAAHPLVAPAVRPKAILRWTSRKKTTTGIAVSVEAAISPPQSVLRLVP